MILLALASLSSACGSRVAAETPADAQVAMDRDPPPAPDSAAPDPAPDVECPASERMCAGRCVDAQTDVLNCGACGVVCPTTDGGAETCVAGVCRPPPCPSGFHPIGEACVANGGVRPVQPVSLGDTTLRRPTFRFVLPSGADGAVIDLCRDRACTMLLETLRVTGTTARPSAPLPASSVVFWRARARVGAADDTGNYGATWILHTPARDNSSGVDSSFNPHFDVNGDGFDDVVVGAPGAVGWEHSFLGTVSVFHGSATGVAPAPARVLSGTVVLDSFGERVANAGDVNGDGFADLVVGVAGATASGMDRAGAARVFHGSSSGIAATPARVLAGRAERDRFGSSAAGAGDVDADGFADVIVGAAGVDVDGRIDAGSASIFHGSASGIAATPTRVLEGETAGEGFGSSAASAGDVNGDGFADIVIGAWEADDRGRIDAGIARVFHGSRTGVLDAPALVRAGSTPSARLGRAVASAGDVNGDGFADVVIGASGSGVFGQVNRENALVFHGSASGLSANPAFVFERPEFGVSVSSAGDLNGDGFDDIAVGAILVDFPERERAGAVCVFHGSATGLVAIPARVLEGASRGSRLGRSVARAGDVDRDGFADIIVGASGTPLGNLIEVGAAIVFRGNASGVSATPARVLEGAGMYRWFGESVASVSTTRRTARARLPALACSR